MAQQFCECRGHLAKPACAVCQLVVRGNRGFLILGKLRQTGFHLLTWGTHSTEDVARALKESLEFIAYKATWDDVPATTIESCGNYRDHSLFTAKEWAKDILAKGISSDPFERRVV